MPTARRGVPDGVTVYHAGTKLEEEALSIAGEVLKADVRFKELVVQ